TCHWCHVMEEESFEDLEIAEYINKHYIAIKVDREERPDIDSIYMKAVVALNGNGGWPMTVFVTWDKKPFYGGTYFPARDGDRGNPTGFLTILNKLNELYQKDKTKIKEAGDQLFTYLKDASMTNTGGSLPTREVIEGSIKRYKIGFDKENGGLTGQHKFPSSLPLDLLMRHYLSSKDDQVLQMITLTLDKMMDGGIHDQVGGGFHRYTTDSIWLTPHYEKMLYDNALLASLYLDAARVFNNKKFSTIAKNTLDFMLEVFRSKHGAYIASLSAIDNKGVEGGYYLWQHDELKKILSKNELSVVELMWQLEGPADLEGGHHLVEVMNATDAAEMLKIPPAKAKNYFKSAKRKMLHLRNKRNVPRDDKLLAAWNGLALTAFSKAAKQFKSE
ncbi:MAG: thioredoxin domain-containing protein, partial [Desulfobacteraceae bacterium]|nr:thioredoxin domain-containing protein [Desulfobacteraceae bacterium]